MGNGFLIDEEDIKKYPAPNIILMYNLLPRLKSYWYDKCDFGYYNWKDNRLRINGDEISVISDDNEWQDIKNHIENLKNLYDIKNKIDGFKEELKKIIIEGNNLSKEIGSKVNRYIENGEYDNPCKFCEKYINS